jgi:hypothetical protein
VASQIKYSMDELLRPPRDRVCADRAVEQQRREVFSSNVSVAAWRRRST